MVRVLFRLLSAAALIAAGACSAPEETGSEPEQASAAVDTTADSGAATGTSDAADRVAEEIVYPTVSRTGTGNGGVVALAEVVSFEFDYAPYGNRCQAAADKFKAKGADLTDPGRTASIDYAEIVDPNSGRVLGPAFQLEVRTGTDEVWATYVGTGLAGTLDEVSITASDGGGQVLSATGVAVAFRNNGAMIGRKAPFRIEAACF